MTLDGLYQKLEHRRYKRVEYGQALDDLMQRGWVKEEAGEYQVTALGRGIRQAAEEATDQYFYAPWACFNQQENEELENLLALFHDGLLANSGRREIS